MLGNKYVFQMSGIKNLQKKRELLQGIKCLHGSYIGGSEYREEMTHLIVIHASASEKFISACAGGKWIVTPEFVLDSVKQNAWLSEALYELNLTANTRTPSMTNPLQKWREKVARGVVSGAFQGWTVCLHIEDPDRRSMFERILKAGKAVIDPDNPAVTLVFTKDGKKIPLNHLSHKPHHTLSYIAHHLFGSAYSSLNWCINLDKPNQQINSIKLEPTEDCSPKIEDKSMDAQDNFLLFGLEEKFKDYIVKMELRKRKLLKVPELFSYYTPVFPTQVSTVDFSNVRSLVECGLFSQALEEVESSLQPGVFPPASILHACMQHALQGEAEPYFLSIFTTTLNSILRNNPSWGSPESVKYFLQILQCPQCKNGAWPLLQTSVRFCLAGTATCHSLPGPTSPELLHFLGNLQAFFLRVFQLELHAAGSRRGGSRSSVLYSMFWNVWEKSTLSSRALQQLAELLVEAALWGLHSTQERKMKLLATLQELLAVVVKYWAQEHSQLNSRLVDKGFQDLAEYIAILCQDLHPDILRELVPALPCLRLRMRTADAIYRNICSRNGLLIRPEPLTLLKIVSSYLKALGQLCGCKPVHTSTHRTERSISTSPDSQVSNIGERERVGGSGSGKENIPRGFHRVNAAGETLLHRACKRNQVETVLHILSLPGTDANVKDHAGWTPLHEACNHGSSECVAALLQHCPGLQLDSQVKGVSPLHDALLNQHTDIAKMLLRHAGSSLLRLRDDYGRSPLDLVFSSALRTELQRCAQEADSALEVQCSEVRDLEFIETCSCLLSCLLLSYLLEHHIPSYEPPEPPLDLAPSTAQALVSVSPGTVASHWRDRGAVSLAEDLRTVMSMEQYVLQVNPALMLCQGPHTSVFMQLLKDLQREGSALLSGQSEL
ncbi:SMC5-SMC6 complex localization factor protein 1 isoform X1 [Astyanax mexicanus]|uniref:SMC5-SMC6 complex localization factor protein 1 isoform X1 n=2 Tax=Astyanax mexicanus TaxID=7994 RepID=UPI0020CAFFFC|nr:SMC5-SMC6 complex localization factor protein 1 isoform X1 [Astyanax mexicanus]XP_022523297.2 SMC5-SMC6 complex localization factor protein 1 isoform X1 [Astyanax mexicanus]